MSNIPYIKKETEIIPAARGILTKFKNVYFASLTSLELTMDPKSGAWYTTPAII